MDIYPNQSKHCNKCNTTKSNSEFNKDETRTYGLQEYCISCNTLEEIKEVNKDISITHGLQAYCISYNNNILGEIKENLKERNTNSKEKPKRQVKKHISHIDEYFKEYYQSKKDATAYNRSQYNRYIKKREDEDPLLKVIRIIRSLVSNSFNSRGYKADSHTYNILGCSYEQLKSHMEMQFKEGMSWDNHGQWHIDHIIPVSYGLNIEEIIALNNYINLQPLWAIDNLRKGNRYIG